MAGQPILKSSRFFQFNPHLLT